jgi:FkbH-like protein
LSLVESLAGWHKYASQIAEHQADLDTYLRLQFYVFIDYLELFLRTGDDTYRSLYIGEKLKQLHDSTLTREEDADNRRRVTDGDIRILCGHVRSELGGAAALWLESLLREIQEIVTRRGRKELNLLLIGDCLYLDIQGFLAPWALEDGISFRPTFLGRRNPLEQRSALLKVAENRFDLIFYSPFTYELSLELIAFHNWRRSLTRPSVIRASVGSIMEELGKNLDILLSLFDVPVYVHNTINVRRHDSSLQELAKALLTRRARRVARQEVNRRLAALVADRRAAQANLILFDETEMLNESGELTLGRRVYSTPIQHPAELGRRVAHRYREILAVHTDLVHKKLVVCDLDNTLWAGVAGEGPVTHLYERQTALKELKSKGVLLAVNSKNDPQNVRWDGAALAAADFVRMEVNWDSKVANMRRIQEALNLKPKDFVFVDDRADQRELVREAYPEIHVLDAMSERSWKQLALWGRALPDQVESDRTEQYRERTRRESFLAKAAETEEDPARSFARLDIRVQIRPAKQSELKRVTELINRTNQFNLTGARVSLKEIRAWHAHSARKVAVVEAQDKFGAMGLVCAALLDQSGHELQIPVFVLSCRVFGYGIEHAVLGAVKRLAIGIWGRENACIRGAFRETTHNQPCSRMYPENRFTWDGASWMLSEVELPVDPVWLSISDQLSSAPAKVVS